MRPVLFVALLPFSFALAAPVQRFSSRPFKGANVILLRTHQLAGASVRRLAELSQRLGYTVDSLTEHLLVTAAQPMERTRNVPMAPAQYYLTAFVMAKGAGGTTLGLWGALRFTDASGWLVERTMRWDGPRDNSPVAGCFGHAQQLAQFFPAEWIRYTKEKGW